jgi:molybdopterin synthase sulfur carrier subunit
VSAQLVTVRYWAAAKAAAGRAEDSVEARSVAEALEAAQRTHGAAMARVLSAASVLVDGVRVDKDDPRPLEEGAVVEVLPPFAGG